MHLLSYIFPSWHEWGKWLVLFTAGYILRKIYLTIETDTRKFRKKIIHAHVESGHKGPLKTCTEDSCGLLSDAVMADHF